MPKKRNPSKPEEKIWNVFFCGTGGQGVLTASEICALAAMHCGFHVKKSEVHGMAQRGGSVESHLRFGTRIFSPLINPGTADVLVCFNAAEGERLSGFLKKNGVHFLRFLNDPAMTPPVARFGNTYYLGVLSSFLPVTEEAWQRAMREKLKRNLDENLLAWSQGRAAAAKILV